MLIIRLLHDIAHIVYQQLPTTQTHILITIITVIITTRPKFLMKQKQGLVIMSKLEELVKS